LPRLWASPNSLLGLGLGSAGMLFGAQPLWDAATGILCFVNMPAWLMPTAMSLGHVHVYGPGCHSRSDGRPALNRFGVAMTLEESLHTRQSEVLGPFYLPLHALCMIGSMLGGGGTHNHNPLEFGPERGRGPWPWN
jgi:hypothetical protein